MELSVFDHFKFKEIQKLYLNQEDLKLAFPSGKFPLNQIQWDEWISKEDAKSHSLLFYKDSELIAHLALKSYIESPGLCYLCFFIVHPNLRGRGISKKVLEKTYSFVKNELHKNELWLVVSEENIKAHGLYKKEEFSVIDKKPGGLRMRKTL